MEDKEVRFSFSYVTEDAPQQHASPSIVKYTGMSSAPGWTDINQGSVFNFNDFVRGAQAKQTSSRRCALYEPISPLLRTRQSAGKQARYAIRGVSM